MRLTHEEHLAISNTIHQADAEAKIYLFGSRVDDTARGGDIDLLILSKKIDVMAKLAILAELHRLLGARKIDIAVYPDTSRPFPRMTVQSGVPL